MENKPEKTDTDKINELYSLIDNLKSSFQSQISELSAKIEQQNNQIIELQKKLECNSIKNVINKENINVFEESLIINNNANYISNLKKWIQMDEPLHQNYYSENQQTGIHSRNFIIYAIKKEKL